MAQVQEAQLRLLYSLLKLAVRVAARFHVPMRTVSELTRLAYFEHLQHEGLSQAEIARRLGQTDRHMRSLRKRLESDFFAAEHEVGIVRELENLIASEHPEPAALHDRLPGVEAGELDRALSVLTAEGRVELGEDGHLRAPARYVVLSSDQFHHRIDALNHFLDGVYRAIQHRLVHDEREGTMIKTISFTALPASLARFVARFEGELRRDVAALEEEAAFDGETDHRYVLGVALAPHDD